MIKNIYLWLQILQITSFSFCAGFSETRNLRHGFEFSADYSSAGSNWAATVPGAFLCDAGQEQSPIDL